MRDVPISEFRAKCLGLVKRVRKTGQPLRITRRGIPIAEVVPCGPNRKRFIVGDMVGTAEIVGDIVSPVIEPMPSTNHGKSLERIRQRRERIRQRDGFLPDSAKLIREDRNR